MQPGTCSETRPRLGESPAPEGGCGPWACGGNAYAQPLPSHRLPPIKLAMITIVPTVSFGSPQQPDVALSQIPAPTAAGTRIHASVFMMIQGYGEPCGS